MFSALKNHPSFMAQFLLFFQKISVLHSESSVNETDIGEKIVNFCQLEGSRIRRIGGVQEGVLVP